MKNTPQRIEFKKGGVFALLKSNPELLEEMEKTGEFKKFFAFDKFQEILKSHQKIPIPELLEQLNVNREYLMKYIYDWGELVPFTIKNDIVYRA